jgi:HTH-type transcriptional regulator / antitoxin HipB
MNEIKPINELKELGMALRQARKKSALTQAKAAATCGVGTRFLSELENGKPTLHVGKVLQVLKNFGFVLLIKRKGFTND